MSFCRGALPNLWGDPDHDVDLASGYNIEAAGIFLSDMERKIRVGKMAIQAILDGKR